MAIPVTFLAAYFLIFTLPYLLMSAANPTTVAAGQDLASKETWILVLAAIPLALLALFPVTVMIARLLFRKASLRSADLTSWNQR